MPSGITHMLLAKSFNEGASHGHEDLELLLAEHVKIFQVGALAPDLAYSQQLPNRDLFNDQDEFADLFHYKLTNQVPLRAFAEIRTTEPLTRKDKLFAFFLGYCSHMIADGIIHPFVRDKVGNYFDKGVAGRHRALEMRLDCIFLDHLTGGIDVNFAELHDQIKDVTKPDLVEISDLFSRMISSVYKTMVEPPTIVEWVDDLHDIFEIAANSNNCYYARFPGMSTYLYNDSAQVLANKEQDLLLRRNESVGRVQNFAGRDIHFLRDCVPLFYRRLAEFAVPAYDFVFSNGRSLDEDLLPSINLDTGRSLVKADGNDLNQPPILWEGVTGS
jgi:hypothetical protein